MSAKELDRFLEKVKELNALVESLERLPNRKKLLSDCKNHDQVVELAESWGYKIGRRWGESN